MAMTAADLKALALRYRAQSEVIGIAVLAIAISLWLGGAAKRQAAPLISERDRLRAAQHEVSSFRSAFKPAAAGQDSLRLPDTLAISVAHDSRIALAQRIAQQAERGGLRNVRVKFAAADTTSPPPAPQLLADAPQLAPYTIVIEADGGYGTILSLVRGLPPAVALQHLRGVRVNGTTHYSLILAVFETGAQARHG